MAAALPYGGPTRQARWPPAFLLFTRIVFARIGRV